ncbi:MAG: hypothetical protein A3J38_07335 [Gammaproteobacteria bacterium RIFCSPHIGHO2_12_FULL_45_9]|nr:MAG: hypothetical protein A3J38_07335 [Gammaproteobacteria bacterium RIFCSPHIGHO2_12_FULL_45_9]
MTRHQLLSSCYFGAFCLLSSLSMPAWSENGIILGSGDVPAAETYSTEPALPMPGNTPIVTNTDQLPMPPSEPAPANEATAPNSLANNETLNNTVPMHTVVVPSDQNAVPNPNGLTLPIPAPIPTNTPVNQLPTNAGATALTSLMAPKPVKKVVPKKPPEIDGFVTKVEAEKLVAKGHYRVHIEDPWVLTGHKTISTTPKKAFYFYNAKTHCIGVADEKSDATALSAIKPNLYYAIKGQTLQETLKRWSKHAGYRLRWLSDYDFTLQYAYKFQGEFIDGKDSVLDQILQSFKKNQFAVKAVITKNNVILIQNNTYQPSALPHE